jgi:hypothetical protein
MLRIAGALSATRHAKKQIGGASRGSIRTGGARDGDGTGELRAGDIRKLRSRPRIKRLPPWWACTRKRTPQQRTGALIRWIACVITVSTPNQNTQGPIPEAGDGMSRAASPPLLWSQQSAMRERFRHRAVKKYGEDGSEGTRYSTSASYGGTVGRSSTSAPLLLEPLARRRRNQHLF